MVLVLGSGICCAQQAERPIEAAGTGETTAHEAEAIQRALVLEQQSHYSEAVAAWKDVVKLQPDNAKAYAHLGLIEARQEDYPEAIASYRKAQALARAQKTTIPQLNLNLGLALFKSGNFHDAGALFEAELKQHPNSTDAHKLTILTGMSYYGARQYGAAIPYLREAVATDPRNLSLLLILEHCYLWVKQLDQVVDVYKQILMIDPDSVEADMIAGEALDEKGDHAGAIEQFRAAVQANPKEPNVHFGLAYLLYTQKRYNEAIMEFQRELENDPHNYQAMTYLGDTYVRMSNLVQAKPVLEAALAHQQSEPLVHLDMGIIYADDGENDAAIREFNKTVQLEPDNVAAHFRLGALYRTMGKKDEAKAEFAKAKSLNKKTDESLLNRISQASNSPAPDAQSAQPAKPDQ